MRNWLAEVDPRFVGEVFLTSVDHDGLQRGPCYELLDELRDVTELPIIYSGGIESHNSAKAVLSRPQVSGIAIGAAFHYRRLSPTNLRSDLHGSRH